jgi:2-oxoisovalerate dehydrogenase E1 component
VRELKASPFRRNHLLRDAIGAALHDSMLSDPMVHLFGEGCEVKVHYDHPDIERAFPGRIHTLPISEDGNVNFCVGAALMGYKPVCDIISSDFLYRAMDSICNTAAKAGEITLVIRAEFLTGGPTTGQRPEALFAHIPGLNVVVPSTPRDAAGLMRRALQTRGVTLFFEDREVQDDGSFGESDLDATSTYYAGLGIAQWRNMGPRDSVTVVTYGVMRQRVEALVRRWQAAHHRPDRFDEESLDCSIIDLRSIYPLDWALLDRALQRSRKLLIVEPDVCYGGVGAEIAAWAAERGGVLRVKRLGGKRETMPAARHLQAALLPTEEEIADAIRDLRAA